MINKLIDHNEWLKFYEYKLQGGHLGKKDEEELRKFIENKEYLPFCENILAGKSFDFPHKRYISKLGSEKKRVVYTYSYGENTVLKLLTFLLQEKYDSLFCENLYSFRQKRSIKEAVNRLTSLKDIDEMWSYKVDISNYFNSVPIDKMYAVLKNALINDEKTAEFICSLLTNPYVYEKNEKITEEKGIMAGTPIATFLANLYLSHMDKYFYENHVIYSRYSDDIIIFDKDEVSLKRNIDKIKNFLVDAGLSVNPKKEDITAPGEAWVYLGVCYKGGKTDVAPVSVEKLKGKMRRKARALKRWQIKKGLSNEKAVRAFIKVFNRKLFENPVENELTWVRWYFPLINTDESLKIIDEYSQNCIRFLATGKHTKAMYNFRYEDMKQLGYKSLVNAYYKSKEQ